MPRVKPENRKRAKRPKTRRGCVTCKIRRVKCDEGRPCCGRCTSTGRKCDGYDQYADTESALVPPTVRLSSVFECPKEQRSFAFFLERTSRQLAGVYECQFWNGVILQAAQQDAALRYAVVALASFHEGYEKTGEAERAPDDFALQKYNLAIRQHLQSLAQPSKDRSKIESYVASCMVFMCIELIQGHYISAISLVKKAVKLFYDVAIDFHAASGWPVDVFEIMLSRLQSQAVDLLSADVVGETILPRPRPGMSPRMPAQFHSVHEAKAYLEYYIYFATLSRPSTSSYNGDSVRGYIDILTNWTSSFDKMLNTLASTLTAQDRRTANVLKIWSTMMEIGIGMRVDHGHRLDDQTLWDLYQYKSEEVVRLAEIVLEDRGVEHRRAGEMMYRFTLDLGIVGPLYDTARLCRDPMIRRKAIYLLRMYPCREGLWDSLLAARSAEKQMELEESAVTGVTVAQDVPGWARITSAMPEFQFGQRWASMVYTRQAPLDGTQPTQFHEVLEW